MSAETLAPNTEARDTSDEEKRAIAEAIYMVNQARKGAPIPKAMEEALASLNLPQAEAPAEPEPPTPEEPRPQPVDAERTEDKERPATPTKVYFEADDEGLNQSAFQFVNKEGETRINWDDVPAASEPDSKIIINFEGGDSAYIVGKRMAVFKGEGDEAKVHHYDLEDEDKLPTVLGENWASLDGIIDKPAVSSILVAGEKKPAAELTDHKEIDRPDPFTSAQRRIADSLSVEGETDEMDAVAEAPVAEAKRSPGRLRRLARRIGHSLLRDSEPRPLAIEQFQDPGLQAQFQAAQAREQAFNARFGAGPSV